MKNIKMNDLLFVILVGLITATLTGIAVGTVNYLLYTSIGITMNIFYFFGAYFIASYIRRQYEISTRLYQVIAVIMTIHGYFFSYVVFNVFRIGIGSAGSILKLFYSFEYVINFFNPIHIFQSGFGRIIEYLFIFIFCYIAYTKTK
ncbi:MAG: hypothetical protein KJ847_00555 [Firmicutes bacterium]|nr:hypothetical protein [Bacillota bacterium]